MQGFVLVVCRNSNIRRFCVDNLVTRGYIAVGVASADEGREILSRRTPEFVMLCCEPRLAESEIEKIRNIQLRLKDVAVVMVSMERPDRNWLHKWKVAAQFPYPIDARRLIDLLLPWLEPRQVEQSIMTERNQPRQA